jgi:outer membrane protein OmpA-like peptidoglycan-associated protein
MTAASEQTLADLVGTLKTFPQYYLIVRGHCSKEGDIEANKLLAAQRAQAAVDWLVAHGIDKNRVKADVSEPNGSTTVAFIVGQVAY